MAKQFDNLYPQIIDFANLHLAWRKAKRGKRFRQAAATFEVDLEDNLIRLQRQLTEQSWQPGGYRSFRIRDPKLRLVSAAPFPDRVCITRFAMFWNRFMSRYLSVIPTPIVKERALMTRWTGRKSLSAALLLSCNATFASIFPPLTMRCWKTS